MSAHEKINQIKSGQAFGFSGDLSLSAEILLKVLERIRYGQLKIQWVDGREYFFLGDKKGPDGFITIKNPNMARKLVLSGAIGFAESYIKGYWDTINLPRLLENLALNVQALRQIIKLPAPFQYVHRLIYILKPNSLSGAQRNISYHYDLGNDFYRLWLDNSLSYSCACFDGIDGNLYKAQVKKWEKLLSLAEIKPGDRVLEIGCGWGGFAVYAAKKIGCHITALTISKKQYEYICHLIRKEKLEGLVNVRMQDYRQVKESYDKIISIEMFEAVGEKYWPAFFKVIKNKLKKNGIAAMQVITICDERFEGYRRCSDFIQNYIFPGGILPSPQVFKNCAQKADLTVNKIRFFGSDYVLTLNKWLSNFEKSINDINALGFDKRFERMWRYYFAYCIAGFSIKNINVMQVSLRHN